MKIGVRKLSIADEERKDFTFSQEKYRIWRAMEEGSYDDAFFLLDVTSIYVFCARTDTFADAGDSDPS
jgi:hypothetical protein